jgi:hypothetical protein
LDVKMTQMFRVAVVGVALVTGAGFAGNVGVVKAQRNADPIQPPPTQPGAMTSEDASVSGRMGQDRVEAMKAADRRNHAQKDIERMVALTNELQADIAKTNNGELPADIAKKAKEIEKLAHDVQTQIR